MATTIRFYYEKKGTAAYISLLDLQRVMQRALKCSRLPVFYTQGFNPHIYITFAAPLALGQQSVTESFEIKPQDLNFDWKNAANILNKHLPQGIVVTGAKFAKVSAEEIAFAQYELMFFKEDVESAKAAFEKYEHEENAFVEKKGKKGKVTQIDLKQHVKIISKNEKDNNFYVVVVLPAGSTININPALLVGYLESMCNLTPQSADILRTKLLTKKMEQFK